MGCGFYIKSVTLLEVSPGAKLQREIHQEHEQAMKITAQVTKKESEIRFQELELEERRKKMENKIDIARKEAKMQADLDEEIFSQKVEALDRENELAKTKELHQLEAWKASDATVLSFFGNLKELGVDMSAFMCITGGQKATADIIKRSPSLAPLKNEKTYHCSDSCNDKSKVTM